MPFLLDRFGPLATRALMTLLTILGSIGIVVVLDVMLLGRIERTDVLIGTITPGVLGWIMIGSFITLFQKLQRSRDELRTLANEDHLTRLLTRRRFLELAEIEWEKARRHGRPMTIFMVDVDHFKAINDQHGHAAGDAALQHLALVLRQELRRHDVIGRFGGEEFAVLLPETDLESGRRTAERIRTTLESDHPVCSGQPVAMTVSIGLSMNTPQCPRLHALLASADRALYSAKQSGRNRVMSAECSPA